MLNTLEVEALEGETHVLDARRARGCRGSAPPASTFGEHQEVQTRPDPERGCRGLHEDEHHRHHHSDHKDLGTLRHLQRAYFATHRLLHFSAPGAKFAEDAADSKRDGSQHRGEAQKHEGQEKEVFDYYKNNPEAKQALQSPLLEDKVVDFIIELAVVKDIEVSLEELLAAPDEKPKKSAKANQEDKADKKPAKKKKAAAKAKAPNEDKAEKSQAKKDTKESTEK